MNRDQERPEGTAAGGAVGGLAAGVDRAGPGIPGPRMSVLHDGAGVDDATPPRAAAGAVRACTLTLVALVAWVITPPAAVLLFATIGLVGVVGAHRADKVIGHCSLGRPKLIVAYLSVAWVLGAWFTAVEVSTVMF